MAKATTAGARLAGRETTEVSAPLCEGIPMLLAALTCMPVPGSPGTGIHVSAASSIGIPSQSGAETSVVSRPASRAPAVVAFAIPFAALLAYALRGGSYDLIVRQEY